MMNNIMTTKDSRYTIYYDKG